MKYLIILIALALTGCASDDYTQYAKAQSDIATARANSDAARYQALASIASKGDSASGVAAVMAIALGSGSQQGQQQVAAPQRISLFATRRSGSSIANSTADITFAESTAGADVDIALPVVSPFQTTATPSFGYAWYFGMLRCDV